LQGPEEGHFRAISGEKKRSILTILVCSLNSRKFVVSLSFPRKWESRK
jgi:hypothetical protein